MSKADSLKEEIGWLKVVFTLLVAVDISLIGWLAQNYIDANIVVFAIGCFATIVVTSIAIWSNRRAYRRIKELEDL